MTGSNDKDAASGYTGADRRSNHHLREVFERAYEIAYPILDPGQSHSDPSSAHFASSSHFLRIALHDAFPQLHPQDIAILSVSIVRVYRERNRPGNGN